MYLRTSYLSEYSVHLLVSVITDIHVTFSFSVRGFFHGNFFL